MPIQRITLIAIAIAALAGTAPAASATVAHAPTRTTATPVEQGRILATRFFRLLQRGDVTTLGAFLAPEFQLQRADGTGATKRQYLRAPADVERFALSRFRATRAANTLVVRYWAVTSETIDGTAFSTTPAPRLSVFRLGPTGWRIVAHANFNAPS